MGKVNILGVNISDLGREQVKQKVKEFLQGGGQHQLVTPNAEIILAARRDRKLLAILNKADLAILDGSGPQIAARLLGKKIERYPGADLTVDILKMAAKQKIKVGLILRRP